MLRAIKSGSASRREADGALTGTAFTSVCASQPPIGRITTYNSLVPVPHEGTAHWRFLAHVDWIADDSTDLSKTGTLDL